MTDKTVSASPTPTAKPRGRRKRNVPAPTTDQQTVEEYISSLRAAVEYLNRVSYEITGAHARKLMAYPNGKIVSTPVPSDEAPVLKQLHQLALKRLGTLLRVKNLTRIAPQTALWEKIFWDSQVNDTRVLSIKTYADMIYRSTFITAVLQMPTAHPGEPTCA